MRKKLLLVAVMLTAFFGKSYACFWYSADQEYYNLFAQEIMNDPRYKAFLLTYDDFYYTDEVLHNGNLVEWQNYLGLSYEDTKYLVLESSRDDLRNLTKDKPASDSRLSFATPEFVKKHKQALLYLAYVKYLEPYMRIIPGEDNEISYWEFQDDYEHNAGDLDYNKEKTVLTKSWNAETDAELKLRYGYQLVRLAHYTRRYSEAVQLFNQYVEPVNLRTEMYYYALSQKAGALRGMGETEKANRDFIRVFANSYDLKRQAYISLTLGWEEIDFSHFVSGAADDNERNDIYLMMGYSDFNNPANEITKIIANNPDAIQAKVLTVRAINRIERNLLTTYPYEDEASANTRYPYWNSYMNEEFRPFFNQVMSLCDRQVANASDKNFWNLASSYMHFLNMDFDHASQALNNVKSGDDLYMTMVRNLTAYIDICRQPRLTSDVETELFAKYADLISTGGYAQESNPYCFNFAGWPTFVGQVLTNRYALQGDRAKSFLVINHIRHIELQPNGKLLDEIETFLKKKKKNPMEEYIATQSTLDLDNPLNYINYVKGVLCLTDGEFKDAKSFFEKQTRLKVSKRIFGHNTWVGFYADEDLIMNDDYISEFSFIHDNMTELEVTEALIQLQKIGKKKGDEAAKANYLIANFLYNVSPTGYFRHYLRFDNNNAWTSEKYSLGDDTYKNTMPLSTVYLNKAMETATDNELKAHIVFALAKNAQQDLEATTSDWYLTAVIPEAQFEELEQYRGTSYFKEVSSNCMYFQAYLNGGF